MTKKQMFERNQYLISEARRQVARYHHDTEEVEAQGTLALLQAIDRFDPKRGVKFQTYARQVVRGEMKDYLRRDYRFHHPRPDALPRLEAGSVEGGAEPLLARVIDPSPQPEEQVLSHLMAERVAGVIAALPARAREIVRLRYWEGCGLSECGRRLGITPQTVQYHERRALGRLQWQLKDWREE